MEDVREMFFICEVNSMVICFGFYAVVFVLKVENLVSANELSDFRSAVCISLATMVLTESNIFPVSKLMQADGSAKLSSSTKMSAAAMLGTASSVSTAVLMLSA